MRVLNQRLAPLAAGACIISLCLIAPGLSGCISLLPKEKPAQLYRFGADVSAVPAPLPPGPRFTVRAAPLSFATAAAADRILTIDGEQTAYIAGARWITTAGSLFEAAVTRAFEVHAGHAKLMDPGEPGASDYVLKIDVRAFEARYDHGQDAPPRIVVEVYAALASRQDPTQGADRLFQAETPAESNSAHAIAAAFDQAVVKVLGDLVAWVNARGV